MDKGYYSEKTYYLYSLILDVAIHNKNGQGLLPKSKLSLMLLSWKSQSTIKMDKGYYE